MPERRQGYRFEPTCEAEEQVTLEGDISTGVVGNLSREGICVIVLPDVEFEVNQEVTVDYRGYVGQAIVRNVTQDSMTVGYGLEWVDPLPSALLPRQLGLFGEGCEFATS